MTEQHGAWSLELHAPDGAWVRQLLPPHFGLRTFCGFARNGRELLVTGAVDPREQHVWRLDLAGGEPQRLTDGGGVHTVWSDRDTYLLTSARRDGGTLIQAIRGTFAVDLPTVAERPPVVPTTQLDHVIVEDRVHYVAITRPTGAEPGRRYPVLLKVYAGPHVQTVVDARDTYTVDQWYADAGFIVVRIDGRGTPSRGRTWERAVLGDLGTIPLADQTDALLALGAKHPELDLDRVGVFGWSFGGYMSAMAVLRRPDVYKAAVAGAPVTDWALYDTAYTERYMKTPAANTEGYARASALTYADGLSRPLLLLHGITDDNVHFAHALALIEALYLAGRRAEVVTLSATHMVPDPRLASARERAHVDFFRAHLGAPGEDR
jgi:dipeptidyl-peptidase-4